MDATFEYMVGTQKAAMASLEARNLTCDTYLSTCRLMAQLGPALVGNLGSKCADFTASTHNLTTMFEFIRHDLWCPNDLKCQCFVCW